MIYALSRREYGNVNRWIDGSSSSWAATAVRKGGTLSRRRVGAYDSNRARSWGKTGLPNDLEEEAANHRVAQAAFVANYAEARDALANKYPIAVGSNVGFETGRDEDGYCARKGKWNHCMKFVAVKDDERPALLCMNSWAEVSPTGPQGRYAIPAGSFWVDAETFNLMLKQKGAFALPGFSGYQLRTESFAVFTY